MRKKLISKIVIILIIAILCTVGSAYAYNSYKYSEFTKVGESYLEKDEFNKAIQEFQKAKEYKKNEANNINEKIDNVNAIKTSKQNYEIGIEEFNNENYLEAVQYFKKVITQDKKRYALSKEKIDEYNDLYIEKLTDKAKKEAEEKNYEDAIETLQTILENFPENEEVSKLQSSFKSTLEEIKKEEERLRKEAEEKARLEALRKEEEARKNAEEAKKKAEEAKKKVNTITAVKNRNGYVFYKGDTSNSNNMIALISVLPIRYATQPTGAYIDVRGNEGEFTYKAIFHFNNGNYVKTGVPKSSSNFVPVGSKEASMGQKIKVDFYFTYKGKTYPLTQYYVHGQH